MRTTVTLDADTEAIVRRLMQERRIGFKRALNEAIRAGAQPHTVTTYTRVQQMGRPRADLDRALQLSAAMEDDAIAQKLQLGK